jgi:type IV pilus assembly protein PilB
MALFGKGGKHAAGKSAPERPSAKPAPASRPRPAARDEAVVAREKAGAAPEAAVAVIELRDPPLRLAEETNHNGKGSSGLAERERPVAHLYAEERPAAASERPLGELLVAQRLVDADQLAEALSRQPGSGHRLGELLVSMGALDERSLTTVLASQFGVGTIDLSRLVPDPALASRISEKTARDLKALPVRETDGVVEVIVGDLRPGLEEDVKKAVGGPVRLYAVPPSAARQVIDRSYKVMEDVDRLVKAFVVGESGRVAGVSVKEDLASAGSPVAQLVVKLVTQALRDRASDIHIEPTDGALRVRFRIDGSLTDVLSLPVSLASPLVSRVKILANMNIVERRRPQDGQFATEADGRGVDIRVSTVATVFGEKCVMRLLDKDRSLLRLDELGMPADTHSSYSKMIRSPFGMVISAGPTGSGKTTTLYATLAEIDERSRNIVTIEDPVEAVFPTANQIQTNDQAGVTFADGLRAILRQDPDVIMVGEIRDIDTARIAVQAALTGHFVVTSLHATDSVAALHRFLDMGIEAFLVASSVLGVVSQRLLRRTCRSCAAPYKPNAEELAFYHEAGGHPKDVFLQGRGCNICAGTGYQDRTGVYEFLHMTPEIRRLLVGWATQDELRRIAIKQGMRTLRSEGIALVEQDITTIHEVVRSIYSL